jgi:hypothetical protein
MNYTDDPYPVAPWDTAGLPPRTMPERCARHKHCAYRDDDPARCSLCHASSEKCKGTHGNTPNGGFWGGNASASHATLKAGQCNHPGDGANRRSSCPQPSGGGSIRASRKSRISGPIQPQGPYVSAHSRKALTHV